MDAEKLPLHTAPPPTIVHQSPALPRRNDDRGPAVAIARNRTFLKIRSLQKEINCKYFLYFTLSTPMIPENMFLCHILTHEII
jgi:hypothetical protein